MLFVRFFFFFFFFFFSICACLVMSVSFSSWCLGRATIYDCGTPWTFLLLFFSSFVLFFVLLMYLVGPAWRSDHSVENERSVYLGFGGL